MGLEEKKENEMAMRKFQKEERRARRKARREESLGELPAGEGEETV